MHQCCCDDGDGEGYFPRYSTRIHHLLVGGLLKGLRLAVQDPGDGTGPFLSRQGAERTNQPRQALRPLGRCSLTGHGAGARQTGCIQGRGLYYGINGIGWKEKTMRFGTFVKMLRLSGIAKPPRRSSGRATSSKPKKETTGTPKRSARKKT
jgi:hypothetical protein